MVQISDQVSLDPALSAKLLKISSSAMYQSRRTATNVRQAVCLLGTHAAIMISLSFSLAGLFKGNTNCVVDNTLYWRRAILSALSCRALGEKLGLENLDDLFLAGLLQDIGMLAFDVMLPEEYQNVYSVGLDHDSLIQAEKKAFGSGHDEVGHWLLKRWDLPEYLQSACLSSHAVTPCANTLSSFAACVVVSGAVADNLIKPGDVATAIKTGQLAHSLLALDSKALTEVMEIVTAGFPAVEDLFDITLLHKAEAEAIMAEAKDLLVLHDLHKVRELEEKSQRDALTGAHNRGYYDDMLRREFELASRHGWPLSIALIDLDHFKMVNDTYGHPAGDGVLISVVRSVLAQLRQGDIFARYGGEEFALILPGTGREAALVLARRLNTCIGGLTHVQENGRVIQVSASIGIVAHMEDGICFNSPTDMIKAVDEALYWAKSGGRNQVAEWKKENSVAVLKKCEE